MSVTASSEQIAENNLRALLPSYCRTIRNLNGYSNATKEQVALADQVDQFGFDFTRRA